MSKKIKTVNVVKTKYIVVQKACEELRWNTTKSRKICNIYWQDSTVSIKQLATLGSGQKINHFPGIHEISRKNLLCKNLSWQKKQFKDSFSFFPKTWLMPLNFSKFSKQAEGNFIVKPESSSQGRGIYLIKKAEELKEVLGCLVQTYICQPLLIKGLKFDLRIYVLITSCNPLKVFIYEEGIARFSTDLYEEPCEYNISNKFVHLTNYAVNKKNSKFVPGNDIEDEESHKQAISTVFKRLESQGINCSQIWEEICDIAVKTVLTVQPYLKSCYLSAVKSDEKDSKCFEILGFDILIDKNLKPWLLEVNFTPSFSTDSQLDSIIKQSLIVDTLKKVSGASSNEFSYAEIIKSSLYSEKPQKWKYLASPKESFRKFSEIYPGKNKPVYQKILKNSEKYWKTCSFRHETHKSPERTPEICKKSPSPQVTSLRRAYTPIERTGDSTSPIRSRLLKQALEKASE